jgi:hypothetical protein
MKTKLLAFVVALTSVLPLYADSSARTILYHSKDIVNIRAKVKYTTLIQLPTTEKIIEAATGDKEFLDHRRGWELLLRASSEEGNSL